MCYDVNVKKILFVFVTLVLISPTIVFGAPVPATPVKLQVSNFVSDPGNKLGSDEANRKYQCEMIPFNIAKFDRNDQETKAAIKAQLNTAKINLVDSEAEFIKLEKTSRASTAIYEKINDKATQCPSDTVAFTKSTDTGTTSTASEDDKCTNDSKTITVAINNYPSLNTDEIKDHEFYSKKIGANFMCSHIKVPVPKPKDGIKANFNEIKKYLSEQVTGISLVDNREQFDKLSGDQMKKSVVLSSLKCSCEGPNSIDYTGISFKDGSKILQRESTAADPNKMSIGYDPDPNKGNDKTGTGDNKPPDKSTGTGQSNQNAKTGVRQPTKTATPNPTPYQLTGNCIKVSGQLVCFIDEESKNLYRQGKLTTLLKTTVGAIQKNIGRSRDKHGYVDLVVFGSATTIPKLYREATNQPSANPLAFACIFDGSELCDSIARKTIGSVPKKNMRIIVTRASDNPFQSWSVGEFKSVIDHEWSHIYDVASTFRGSYDAISSNPKYNFVSTFQIIKDHPVKTADYTYVMRSYPECFSGAIIYANSNGAPWSASYEVLATTFQIFNNPNARERMNNLLTKYNSPNTCSPLLNKTIDQHNTFFN